MNEIIVLPNIPRDQIIFKRFKYIYYSQLKSALSYRCTEYRSDFKCPALLQVSNDLQSIVSSMHEHNHTPLFPVEVDILVEIQRLKKMTGTSMEEIKRLYDSIYSNLDSKYGRISLNPFWKPWSTIRSTFHKIHQKNKGWFVFKLL